MVLTGKVYQTVDFSLWPLAPCAIDGFTPAFGPGIWFGGNALNGKLISTFSAFADESNPLIPSPVIVSRTAFVTIHTVSPPLLGKLVFMPRFDDITPSIIITILNQNLSHFQAALLHDSLNLSGNPLLPEPLQNLSCLAKF
jgi:hypothetical protein